MRTRAIWGGLASAVFLLSGCAGFFPANSTSTSTTSSSGDYVYVVNTLNDTLSEFVVGSGTLTAVTGSPLPLAVGLLPMSVAVSRPNTYVFVGGTGTIAVYSIGTGGALTAVSGGGISAVNSDFVALDVSPDGNWLIALDAGNNTGAAAVDVYKINTSTGVLSVVGGSLPIAAAPASGTISAKNVRISPNGNFVAATLGTGGFATFTFNTSTGVLTSGATYYNSPYQANAVSFDTTSGYLWIGQYGGSSGTSGVATFTLNSSGVPTLVGSVAATGEVPYGLLIDSADAYVYTANRNGGNISGFTNSNGSLTQLASSPYPAGTLATALVEDNSHKYVIAASYGGAPDVTLFSFDAITAGKLDAVATAIDGTGAGAQAIAATH